MNMGQVDGQAGAYVEITPAMIEAWVIELRDRRIGESLSDVVHDVFLAMWLEAAGQALTVPSREGRADA